MTRPYTELDFKKYAFAKAARRIARVADIAGDEIADEHALVLDNALVWMGRAAFLDSSLVDDPDGNWPADDDKARYWGEWTYDDGRPVSTELRYGPADFDYVVHVWHPDPSHPSNAAGAQVAVDDDRYGLSITVIALGVIALAGESVASRKPSSPRAEETA